MLGGARELEAFADAGLDHVQLSFQDIEPDNGDRIGGLNGAHAQEDALRRRACAPPACR